MGRQVSKHKRRLAEEDEETVREDYVQKMRDSYPLIISTLMQDLIVSIDKDGDIVFLNDAAVEFWGKPSEEIIGTHFSNYLDPEDVEKLENNLQEMIRSKRQIKGFISTLKTPRGVRKVAWNALVVFDDEGNYIGAQATGKDLTDLLHTEEKLRASEERFKYFLENAPEAIWVQDINGIFMDGNKRAEELTGYKKEELLGKNMFEMNLVPSEYIPMAMKEFDASKPGEISGPNELEVIRKDGSILSIEASTIPIKREGKINIIGVARDITERKRAEKELIRLSSAVKISNDSIVISDLDGTIVDVNEATLKMYGSDNKSDLIGTSAFDLVVPEEREKALAGMKELLEKGYLPNREYNVVAKDGSRIPVEMSTAIMKDADGKPIGFVSISRDITERKRAVEALKESEEKYRAIINAMNDTAWVIDFDGKFVDVNDAAVKVMGYSREELLSMGPTDIDNALTPEQIMNLVKGMKSDEVQKFETAHTTKDGKTFPVEISSSLVTYHGKPAILSIARDITDRKKQEEMLRKAREKFETYFDLAQVILVAIDAEGNVIQINKKGCEVLGYKKKEIVGKNWFNNFLPEKLGKKTKTYFKKLLSEQIEPVEYYENPVLTKDGKERLVAWHNIVLRDEQGNIKGTLSSGEDITERKKTENELKESEEKFRTIFEGATDGILAADPETFKFVFTNPRMHEIVGYPSGELINLTIADLCRKEDVPFAIDQFKKQLEGKVTCTRNMPILRKDKTIVYCDISSKLMEIGEKRYLVGFFRDVTEQKKAEEKIKNLAKFHSENPNPVFRIAKDGAILYANKAAQTLRRELERKKNQLVPPLLRKTVRASLRSGLGKKVEVKYSDRIFSFVVAPVTEAGYVNIYGREITERKKIEKELRNSEERFRQVVENAEEWIWEVDSEGLYTYSSPVVEKILGYKPEEIVGKKHFYDLFHPEDKEELKKPAFQDFAEKRSFRDFINRNVHKNGNIVWLSTSGIPILDDEGNLLGYRGADLNVTEQKKAEEALRRSEEEARRLLEFQKKVIDTATAWVNLVDLEGNVILWNRAAELISGYSREEVIGHKKMWKWLYPDPDYRAKLFAVGKEILERGKRLEDFESTIRCKDGSIKTISWYATTVLDEKGKPEGSIAVGIDISEQKRAEEALQESEEKYRELLNGMNDTAWVIDFDGNIIDVNDAAVGVMGYSREEFRSIGLTGIDSNLDPEEIKSLVENMPADEIQVFETEHTTKDGKNIPVEISSSLVTYKGKQAILSIARDITERKKAQEAIKEANRLLKQSNKELESYTYVVSHDLKAPLRTIRSFGSFLLEDYGDKLDETGQDYLQRMVNASSHMNAMIEDLLTLSCVGRKFTEFEKVDLNKLLEEILADLEATIKECNAEVVVDKLPALSVQRVWMRQLFMNLIINGLKFNESKTPKIEVLYKERESDHLFKVRDNGIGIEEEYLERIFNLFDRAPTEKKCEGTGAGLAICKKIVEQLGGEIWVESTPGKGSTFMFTIPREIKQEKEA